jgi:ubiquinone/menaquinone biosynthesis C-methylase UbiE
MTNAVARFTGLAELYDRVRPKPPVELTDVIRQWARVDRPSVVDLGAGTGLSAELWSGRAASVHAIEPAPDMRARAVSRLGALPDAELFTVLDATAERTGLPDSQADVVTASQALHWFDPATTFPEIVRVLRPGGVFAAIDCVWQPCIHPEVDAAYRDLFSRLDEAETDRAVRPAYFDKDTHTTRLRESGLFRFVSEISLHKRDQGDATRLVDIALSQGGVRPLLALGVSEKKLGIARLREVATRHIATGAPWWWTYEVRLAVV